MASCKASEEYIMNVKELAQAHLNFPNTITGVFIYLVIGMVCWNCVAGMTRTVTTTIWPAFVMFLCFCAFQTFNYYQPELTKIFKEFYIILFGTILYFLARFLEVSLNGINYLMNFLCCDDCET